MKRKIKQTIDLIKSIGTKLTTSASLMLLALMLMSGLVLAQPTITTFAPESGAIGSSVTITGTGFNTAAAQNIVFFGATQAVVTAASTNSLTVTVPLGATYQYISVTNLAVNLTTYSAKPFIVTLLGSFNFDPKVDYVSGSTPISLQIGDLDGDGKPDVAVANAGSNTVSVMRNTSTAGIVSFATKVDFSTGSNPSSVCIVDINSDGKPDLAVANYNSNSVSVLLNTSTSGAISFATKVDFSTGTNPRSLSFGDIDSDGKPDLAVANYTGNNISILRNTTTSGIVSFATKIDLTTGVNSGPYSVSIGDLDGDGKTDVAVANYKTNNVSIFRNTTNAGTVSFAAKVDFAAGDKKPCSISIGDINSDGKPDLAVNNLRSNSLILYRNKSTPGIVSFAAKLEFQPNGNSVSIGDINGDGKPDLATTDDATYVTSNTVKVFENLSTSSTLSIASAFGFTTGSNPISVSIGDIDGDGKPDLAVANSSSNNISVLRQVGNTVPASSVKILSFTPESGPIGSSVTITGTGFATTAAQNIVFFGATQAVVTAASANSLTVTVPLGATYEYLTVTNLAVNLTAYATKPFIVTLAGSINFEPKVDFATGSNTYDLSIGDLDGDGKPDLAVANTFSNSISVLRSTSTSGTVSFAEKVDFAIWPTPNSISIGDLDGDGKPDLAVAYGNGVSVLRNTTADGILSFAAKVAFVTGSSASSLSIGDIDGDGKPDLVFIDGVASVLRNTSTLGALSFAPKVSFTPPAQLVSVGDIDSDGKPDLVVANGNAVSVLRNISTSGTVNFAAKVDFTIGADTYDLGIGDLDSDGKPDLVATHNNSVSVVRNTSTSGTVSFAAKLDFATGAYYNSKISIGDIDGDGKPDLAVASAYNDAVSVLRNISTTGTVNFVTKVDFATGDQPISISMGDIDGDGKPDLAVAYYGSNTLSVIRQGQNCILPTLPALSASSTTNCGSVSTTLSIASGTLNDATAWQWYTGGCGGTSVGTGTSVTVNPATTTNYYVRGEGGCLSSSGSCALIKINVVRPAPVGLTTNLITASSATAEWDTVDCAVGYKFQYKIPWQTQWTTLHHNLDYPSKKLRSLLPSTKYLWRVQSKFADGTYSANSANASFTTLALRSGLEMIDGNSDLIVYPNPAADQLTLEFPFTEGSNTKITVLNTIGQTVLEQNSSEDLNSIQLNIQSLTQGLYVVTVINGDETFTARFIKE